MGSFMRSVRSAFVAGVVVVVPFAITAWLVYAVAGALEGLVSMVPEDWLPSHPVLGSIIAGSVALALVCLIGVATRNYVGRKILEGWEQLLSKVPVLSTVYQGVKRVIGAMFSTEGGTAFEKVVVVQWPRPGVYTMGFYTGKSFAVRDGEPDLINVFLPTTPNPTSGFFFMIPADQVVDTDLTVEEAFTLIMSAGIVAPGRVVDVVRPAMDP